MSINCLHADCHKRHVFCKKPQKPRHLWQPVKLALCNLKEFYIMSDAIQKNESKLGKFVGRKGKMITVTDFNIPPIQSNTDILDMKIRVIKSGGERGIFCQLIKHDEYDAKVASIEENDLCELVKAIEALEKSLVIDANTKGDYLESKYATEDGFKVGYYVSDSNINWFIVFDDYGDDTEFFGDSIISFKEGLARASAAISQIKG